ncbi:MAG: zinc-dependent metalloprotease [Acidimicrobiia bacterium]
MNEDLFSQLFELFNQPGPINWRLAEELSNHFSGSREPIEPWMADEYRDLGRLALVQLSDQTPLDTGSIDDLVPIDRRSWADTHLRVFSYLIESLAPKFADAMPAPAPLTSLGPVLLGLQMGIMIGFLSHRTLGYFDIGLPPIEPTPTTLIVPNVEAFATEHSLDRRQVRLWASLREVAFSVVYEQSWVKAHLIRLIERYLDGIEFDPGDLAGRLQGMQDPERLQEMLSEEGGFAGLLTSPEQQPDLEAVQAFVAIVDDYSSYLVDVAAARMLPEFDAMQRALRGRRDEPAQGDEALTGLLGLELRPEGHLGDGSFSAEVVRRWGEESLETMWERPEHLPAVAELNDPVGWAARVLLPSEGL